MNDEYYMKMAINLARKGRGYVSPNPLVGAVIVKNDKVIGKGYHHQFGGNHAEINAIRSTKENLSGAILYVTLEPCCHKGKTPPCVESILANQFSRVVIGTIDPNPLVSCKGIKTLRDHKLDVTTGVLEDECRQLNETFFHYMETGMPFITVKYAQTLDGRIATSSGQSQWISSGTSLRFAHQFRAEHDAILVGCGTVIKDDPALTVRLVRGRNPLRIVVDSQLKIPLDARVLTHQSQARTLIATTVSGENARWNKISKLGIDIVSVPPDNQGHVHLKKLFRMLSRRNISSVLVEGGAAILTSVLKQDLANRLVTIIAPKIIGKGIEAIGELNIKKLDSAKKLFFTNILQKGEDIIVDSRFLSP